MTTNPKELAEKPTLEDLIMSMADGKHNEDLDILVECYTKKALEDAEETDK